MAADIATTEPVSFRAGDTVEWTRTLQDYPASSYSLAYYLIGPSSRNTFSATADGDDHNVTISAAASAALTAGEYSLIGRVTGSDGSFTIYDGRVTVTPDPSSETAMPAGYDSRSFNRRTRDNLRAMVEGTMQFPEAGYTIAGERTVTLRTMDEVINALGVFESLVQGEERAAAAKQGRRTGVYIRLRNPA